MKMFMKLFLSVTCVILTLSSCTHTTPIADQRQPSSDGQYGIDWNRFTKDEKMPPFGKYAGQLVETAQRRAVVLLTDEEKINLGIPVGQIAFANFRHAKTFYVATIPGITVDSKNRILKTKDIVEKIVFSEKHWAAQIRKETQSLEAHSELSIFLKDQEGIQLILNQDTQTKLNQPRELKEPLVYSIEAVRSKQDPDAGFFPSALGPNFALANRLESNTERNMQHRDDPDRIIISNRLDFTGTTSRFPAVLSSKDAVLVSAILKSNKNQRGVAYEVLTDNCTNGLFNILDESVVYKNKIDNKKIKEAVVKFTRKDLKVILLYLQKQKAEAIGNGVVLAAGIDEALNELSKYSEKEARQADIDSHFLLTIPAFINGHLRGRGLIK